MIAWLPDIGHENESSRFFGNRQDKSTLSSLGGNGAVSKAGISQSLPVFNGILMDYTRENRTMSYQYFNHVYGEKCQKNLRIIFLSAKCFM